MLRHTGQSHVGRHRTCTHSAQARSDDSELSGSNDFKHGSNQCLSILSTPLISFLRWQFHSKTPKKTLKKEGGRATGVVAGIKDPHRKAAAASATSAVKRATSLLLTLADAPHASSRPSGLTSSRHTSNSCTGCRASWHRQSSGGRSDRRYTHNRYAARVHLCNGPAEVEMRFGVSVSDKRCVRFASRNFLTQKQSHLCVRMV